ncbi:MAG: VanZ family protein [Candidatus Fimenecus sp.]
MTAKRKAYIVFSWIAVVFCMGFIFFMSSQGAEDSQALSDSVLQKIIGLLGIDISGEFLRKCAHFSEFAGLGLLLSNAIYASFNHRLTPVFALGGSVIYAVSDEIHQIFSEGRACQFTDVLIDSAGALLGVIIAFIIFKIIKVRRAEHDMV